MLDSGIIIVETAYENNMKVPKSSNASELR